MNRSIMLEEIYPHPPEKVWKAITNPKALSAWLMETDFQPYVGHQFTFRTASSIGFDGVVHCEVLLVDEPKKLAYTWQGGPMKKPTVVTWTLTPVAEGTKVKLEHTGFEGLAGIAVSFLLGSGWKRLCRKALHNYLSSPQAIELE